MKKTEMLPNQLLRNCSRKSLGADFPGHGVPAPEAGSFTGQPTSGSQSVGLTLVQWGAETIRLRGGGCSCNPWRGIPKGWQFDKLYREGNSPEGALATRLPARQISVLIWTVTATSCRRGTTTQNAGPDFFDTRSALDFSGLSSCSRKLSRETQRRVWHGRCFLVG